MLLNFEAAQFGQTGRQRGSVKPIVKITQPGLHGNDQRSAGLYELVQMGGPRFIHQHQRGSDDYFIALQVGERLNDVGVYMLLK